MSDVESIFPVTLTATLATLASLLFLSILATLLYTYIRRRRHLSLDRIEADLLQLEKSLEEWRGQTVVRDGEWRRSWHGEWAAFEDYTVDGGEGGKQGRVKRPERAQWKRRSDTVLAAHIHPLKSMVGGVSALEAVCESPKLTPNASGGKLKNVPSVLKRPLRPKRVEVVQEGEGNKWSRLSVLALRSPLNRFSFLQDERIKPFTASEEELRMVEQGIMENAMKSPPLSPPAVVVHEEEVRFPILDNRNMTEADSDDEDDEGSMEELPLPRILSRQQQGSRMSGEDGEGRLSHDSVRLDEFDLEFPLPSPRQSPRLLTYEDVIGPEDEDEGSRPNSQPVSLTTDDMESLLGSDSGSQDGWEMDAESRLGNDEVVVVTSQRVKQEDVMVVMVNDVEQALA